MDIIVEKVSVFRKTVLKSKLLVIIYCAFLILFSAGLNILVGNARAIKNICFNESHIYNATDFSFIGFEKKAAKYILKEENAYFEIGEINSLSTELILHLKQSDPKVPTQNIRIYYTNPKHPDFSERTVINSVVSKSGNTEIKLPPNTFLKSLRIYVGNKIGQGILLEKIEVSQKLIFPLEYFIIIFFFVFLAGFSLLINPSVLFSFFHRYRYAFLTAIFVLMVSCNIHGSSIGVWANMVEPIPSRNCVLYGRVQPIRSDEWLAQTPMHLSQEVSANPFSKVNTNIQSDGMNMVVSTFSPTIDPLIIFKPSLWGYILLGNAKGLSWFWIGRLLLLFCTAYEFLRILSKDRRLISFLGAVFITLSPTLQWWYSTSLVDAVYSTFGFLTMWYYYFNTKKVSVRIVTAVAGAIFAGAFAMCMYPAFLIPLVYFWIACIIFFVVKDFENIKKMRLTQWIPLIISMLCFFALTGYFFLSNYNELKILSSTVYPGQSSSNGGGVQSVFLTSYLFQPVLAQIGMPIYMNYCEYSNYYLPVFLPYLMIPFTWKKLVKQNKLLIILLFALLTLEMTWILVGIPKPLSLILFFNRSHPLRMLTITGLISTLLVLIIIASMDLEKANEVRLVSLRTIFAIIVSATVILLSLKVQTGFFGELLTSFGMLKTFVVCAVAMGVLFFIFCFDKKTVNTALAFCVIIALLGGATVNPIAKGTDSIYDKPIAKEIQRIKEEEPDAIWVGSSSLMEGNYLIMQGVHSLNSVHYYPDIELWQKLDNNKQNEDLYNRYAHVCIFIGETEKDEVKFETPNPDVLKVTISPKKLYELGVRYILSGSALNLNNERVDGVTLETCYTSQISDARIYRIKKQMES